MICVHMPYNPFLVPNRVHNLCPGEICVEDKVPPVTGHESPEGE